MRERKSNIGLVLGQNNPLVNVLKIGGNLTSSVTLDGSFKKELISKLTNALAEELNAWYGYIIVKDFLVGGERKKIADEYEEHAKDEYEDHAEWIIGRINQLGGDMKKIVSPSTWTQAKHSYRTPLFNSEGLVDSYQSIQTNIKNEQDAIETYRDLERFTRDIDPVSNTKIKEILGDEEDHLQELIELLADMNYRK